MENWHWQTDYINKERFFFRTSSKFVKWARLIPSVISGYHTASTFNPTYITLVRGWIDSPYVRMVTMNYILIWVYSFRNVNCIWVYASCEEVAKIHRVWWGNSSILSVYMKQSDNSYHVKHVCVILWIVKLKFMSCAIHGINFISTFIY